MTSWLIDTNVIVRWILPKDPLCPPARIAVKSLIQRGDTVYVGAQNIIEFWSVATRPVSVNGLGMSLANVTHEIVRMEELFPILEDNPAIYRHWRRLVETCGVMGRQVHDARLAALMLAHNVSHILTYNVDDFARFPGIVAIDPRKIDQSPSDQQP